MYSHRTTPRVHYESCHLPSRLRNNNWIVSFWAARSFSSSNSFFHKWWMSYWSFIVVFFLVWMITHPYTAQLDKAWIKRLRIYSKSNSYLFLYASVKTESLISVADQRKLPVLWNFHKPSFLNFILLHKVKDFSPIHLLFMESNFYSYHN